MCPRKIHSITMTLVALFVASAPLESRAEGPVSVPRPELQPTLDEFTEEVPREEAISFAALVISSRRDQPRLVLNTGGPTNTVRSIVFSEDPSRFYSGGLDKRVQSWGVRGAGRGLRRSQVNQALLVQNLRWEIARGLRGSIYTLAASPSNRSLAIAGYGARNATGNIVVYDTATAQVTNALLGHMQTVVSLDYSPNGKKLVSVSVDGDVRVWSGPEWNSRQLRAPGGAPASPQPAIFLTDDLVAVASRDANQPRAWRVALYDLTEENPEPKRLEGVHAGAISTLARDRDGRRWASADIAGNVFLWSGFGPDAKRTLLRKGRVALDLDFGPDNLLFAATALYRYPDGTMQSALEMWDAATGQERDVVATSDTDNNFACAVSPDGSRVVTWDGDTNRLMVFLLKERNGAFKAKPLSAAQPLYLRGQGRKIFKVAFADRDEGYVIGFGTTVSDPANPTFNDFGPVEQSFNLSDPSLRPLQEADQWLSPEAEGWGVKRLEGGLRLQLTQGGQDAGVINLDPVWQGKARSYCFLKDPEGQPDYFAVGTSTQQGVFIYKLANEGECELLRYYRDHAGFVSSLSVSKDGKYLASGSVDETIKIWSLEGLRAPVGTFPKSVAWGADFELKDGKVVLTKSLESGAAWRKGLRVGDAIVAAEVNRGEGPVKFENPEEIYQAIVDTPITQTIVLTVDRRGKRLNERILLVPAWEPLCTLFSAASGEWALWSPKGYYDSSVNGDELFGWQMNRGNTRKPNFYRADDFRDQLERPEVMKRLLSSGSLPAALRLAGNAVPGDLNGVLPNAVSDAPVVTILSPTDAEQVGGDAIDIVARIDYPNRQAAEAMQGVAYVNGSPAQPVETTGEGRERIYRWRISAADFYNRARVVAEAPAPERTLNYDDVFFRLRELPDEKRQPPKLYILALAASDYQHVQPLAFPVADAEAIVKSLSEKSGAYYELGRVIELHDAAISKKNLANVVQELRSDMKGARPDDLLVVFLAGHGLAVDGQYYFVTTDAKVQDLEDVSISWDLLKQVASLPCRKLFMLDTCHSGNAVSLATEGSKHLKAAIRPLKQDEMLVLSATDTNQEAIEFEDLGHGLFTKTILDGFEGQADQSDDGSVFLRELVRFVESEVPRRTRNVREQTPRSTPSELIDVIAVPLVRLR
ncbi:WD domain, G-beta repeat [Planctomycetes bacterium Pan216]|uniref:WD domain, G-beta repeat n=1 Tax=Kolteria novifilia TaxID=2527975 RepID=A0A518AY78_9BACT|nr:WD domain, G-beta repeat [Planctomycetes bacterium Pan216]